MSTPFGHLLTSRESLLASLSGMLQHKRLLPWSYLNGLKVRYTWKAKE